MNNIDSISKNGLAGSLRDAACHALPVLEISTRAIG